MEDIRRRAIRGLKGLIGTREPRREIMWALMGDAEGTLEVPGAKAKVYCRLFGINSLTVRAWNRVVSPTYDLEVEVEVIRQEGVPDDYYVVGLRRIGYSGYANYYMTYVPLHGPTHELRPTGAGSDVVNIYKKAIVELRADPQDPIGMTVVVRPGFYMTPEEIGYYSGGTSPTFSGAPGGSGMVRYDLLYFDCDAGILAIREGQEGPIGYALMPQPGSDEVPLAWIKLASGDTAIQDVNIIDARIMIATMGVSGLVTAHALDPAAGAHTGTLPRYDRWGSDEGMDGGIWNASCWD